MKVGKDPSARMTPATSRAAGHAAAGTHETGSGRDSLRAWLRLLTCTNLVEREVRSRLRNEFDTTLPRFDVLAQLDAAAREAQPRLTMTALSRRLMVTNGNLTALVERLVREQLVVRDTSPSDRRTQVVRLSPAGKRALDAMTPAHQRWIESMFSGLTQRERSQLLDLLGKLRGSLHDRLSEEQDHD